MVRLARTTSGRVYVGDADGFVPLGAALPDATSIGDALPRAAAGELSPIDAATAARRPAESLSFADPLERYRKLWGIGLNYREHADDLDESWPDEPASFMKPATAVVGPGGPIRLPPAERTDRVTAEAELGVVIGRTATDLTPETAAAAIAGYVPVIDCTAEDVLERNPRYLTRAKSFDTFLVLGPWITTPGEIDSLEPLTVRTVIDGEVRAENAVRNMRMGPHELVAFHSRVMTLRPGDVLFTGTPGAATIAPGEEVRASVEAVGTLEATVVR